MSVFTQTVAAPLELVYASFTTATRLCEWFSDDAQLEAIQGGRFYAYWRDPKLYAMGEYLELQENQALRLSWHDSEGASAKLKVAFSAEGDKRTAVQVQYDQDIGPELHGRWERALRALKSTLETGYHVDALERPMLGVLLGGVVNAETAERYGVPVAHGLALAGVLEGLSAAGAGLRANDVLTQVDERRLETLQDLTETIRAHHAGDVLGVQYYRQANCHSVSMELTHRPMQPIPRSLSELATQLEAYRASALKALTEAVAGFKADEAARKPAPEAWSANEVLAHLINTEREMQAFIASLESGNELEVFTSNMEARVRATAKRYGSLAALHEALQDTYAETLELVRHMPESFLKRLAQVVRVQQAIEFDPSHIQRHIGQMTRAVEAARDAAVPG